MKNKPIYDTIDAMNFIKKKYPFIPIAVIRRILFREEEYMYSIGILNWKPSLDYWEYPKKRRFFK